MTDREVMKQALLALEGWDNYGKWAWPDTALEQSKRNTTESLASLRAALEQPEQEPVAWMDRDGDLYRMPVIENWSPPHTLLYTHPPQRKPLTTEERSSIVNEALRGHASTRDAIDWAIRHVERHHGIQPDPAADAMRDFFRTGVGVIAPQDKGTS